MQSTTTKRAVVIADSTDLDMNEAQPRILLRHEARLCGSTECFRLLPAFPPETSRDRPTENMSSDVEHVPVIGRPIGLCSAGQTLSQ
jgi:hypothetical protein